MYPQKQDILIKRTTPSIEYRAYTHVNTTVHGKQRPTSGQDARSGDVILGSANASRASGQVSWWIWTLGIRYRLGLMHTRTHARAHSPTHTHTHTHTHTTGRNRNRRLPRRRRRRSHRSEDW